MMKSLGYVECNGLSGALVAADRMLKTADVELSSVQNTKGNGWITLQVSGELSAITVAIQAVKESLPDIYVTSTVIGRPAKGLNKLGKTDIFNSKAKQHTHDDAPKQEAPMKQPSESADDLTKASSEEEQLPDSHDEEPAETINESKVTCNLCGDPACPRKLGEPHKKCIHYNELNKK